MAHNIFGKRFVGARTPAWHSLGTVIPADQKITVGEALKIGKLDFTYQAVPVGFTDPDGNFIQSGDRNVILRSPTEDDPQWAELGVVSNGYRFIQNQALAEGLDAIAKETGWSFETVGALGKGETVFMTLRTGSKSIFGDELDTYLIISDGKAAQRALQISVARVRVVCENTLLASDDAASTRITIAHDQNVEQEYGFWLGLIGQLQQAQDSADAQLEAMASVKITDKQAKKVIEQAFPMPKQGRQGKQLDNLLRLDTLSPEQREAAAPRVERLKKHHDHWTSLTTERREAAFTLYQRFNRGEEQGIAAGRKVKTVTLDAIRETPYAVLQSVTELVDWGGTRGAEVAAFNATFGVGADTKQRAWTAARKLTESLS